jgi:alpha-L-fucosidase
VPNWYRDAKFRIWAHWGPESAPEFGDWYAQRPCIEGNPTYKYHLENYGRPSKFGYKDICRQVWKSDKFDPNFLLSLYRKPRSNTSSAWDPPRQLRHVELQAPAALGRRGMRHQERRRREFRATAEKQGFRFGVSEHLARSFNWYAAAHGSDKSRPYPGVPYDGNDPAYADLYHDYSKGAPAPAWGAVSAARHGT